jgi:hypothetical protein
MGAVALPPGYVPPHWQAINHYKAKLEQAQQELAEARARFLSQPSEWIPADKELPGNPRCVLATDGEAHFVAVYEGVQVLGSTLKEGHAWVEAYSGDEIDSYITHWMELPEVPAV